MDKALRSALDWWDKIGVDIPDIMPPRRQSNTAPLQKPDLKMAKNTTAPKPGPEHPAWNCKTLDDLRTVMAKFDAGVISDHARQMVFSRGNPKADIMVIGEAPGRDEDIQGKPFVGRSGQLLDRILGSIGLSETDFYITNVINWRPPGNRNPSAGEIALCRPFLLRHMELIDPKIILLVGGIAFQALTGQTGIMKNRGQWVTISVNDREIPTLPIYHPAFLLRQPSLKKDSWRDMLALREKMTQINA